MKFCYIYLVLMLVFSVNLLSDETEKDIELLKPQTNEKPLLKIMEARQSVREFDTSEISEQEISNLLWAAFGINRKETGMRTAPSVMNIQVVEIYVATEKGLFVYEPKEHKLKMIHHTDIREFTGNPGTKFTKEAPINLIFVADLSKYEIFGDNDELKKIMVFSDVGFISQNVYLYCSSENLGTVVLGALDTETLSEKMQLKENQLILLSQPVGHFKTNEKEE